MSRTLTLALCMLFGVLGALTTSCGSTEPLIEYVEVEKIVEVEREYGSVKSVWVTEDGRLLDEESSDALFKVEVFYDRENDVWSSYSIDLGIGTLTISIPGRNARIQVTPLQPSGEATDEF